MSFIVEVPTLFTKPTQMASRTGNTTLTGNERINGNFLINGSLTLNGEINDNNITFESYDISYLNVRADTDLNVLRTNTLQVNDKSLFKDSICYEFIESSVVSNIDYIKTWIVAGESVSRTNSQNISLNHILEGNIFGKKFWAPKSTGNIDVSGSGTSNVWTVAFAFGVVNTSTRGTLFYTNTSHIVLNGPNLLVEQDSSGINIPSFSVMAVTKNDSSYNVYINGILEYTNGFDAPPAEANFSSMLFGCAGIQLLACAVWEEVIDIENLTLESLTCLV